MNPPFKFTVKRTDGWSLCLGCDEWKKTNVFHAFGKWWSLCVDDFEDFWYNEDELPEDFRR